MKNLVYTSKTGKQIVFDDWTKDDEYNSGWVSMCPSCHRKYRGILGNRCDDCGSGWCSVKGCERQADWYVDFSPSEVEEVQADDKAEYFGRKVVCDRKYF